MTDRQAALFELLSRPDDDGETRKHHLKVEGKEDRYGMVPRLAMMHIAWKWHERDEEKLR